LLFNFGGVNFKNYEKVNFTYCFGSNFVDNQLNSNDGTKLVAQTNHWAMPTPKWCPKALMYATECTASGMGCQIVKCKGSDT
jgi:hypothetical protein